MAEFTGQIYTIRREEKKYYKTYVKSKNYKLKKTCTFWAFFYAKLCSGFLLEQNSNSCGHFQKQKKN